MQLSSPITAAGPSPIPTGFPLKLGTSTWTIALYSGREKAVNKKSANSTGATAGEEDLLTGAAKFLENVR
ncbi:MAG: hypothetical protein JG766_40 [Desulfacinum sp.]|jgi:hypothetical protein|nr:hypothetical protein [Desulfacinum sp.]